MFLPAQHIDNSGSKKTFLRVEGPQICVQDRQGYLLHQNVSGTHSAFNGHKKLNSRCVVGLLIIHSYVMSGF